MCIIFGLIVKDNSYKLKIHFKHVKITLKLVGQFASHVEERYMNINMNKMKFKPQMLT